MTRPELLPSGPRRHHQPRFPRPHPGRCHADSCRRPTEPCHVPHLRDPGPLWDTAAEKVPAFLSPSLDTEPREELGPPRRLQAAALQTNELSDDVLKQEEERVEDSSTQLGSRSTSMQTNEQSSP